MSKRNSKAVWGVAVILDGGNRKFVVCIDRDEWLFTSSKSCAHFMEKKEAIRVANKMSAERNKMCELFKLDVRKG